MDDLHSNVIEMENIVFELDIKNKLLNLTQLLDNLDNIEKDLGECITGYNVEVFSENKIRFITKHIRPDKFVALLTKKYPNKMITYTSCPERYTEPANVKEYQNNKLLYDSNEIHHSNKEYNHIFKKCWMAKPI